MDQSSTSDAHVRVVYACSRGITFEEYQALTVAMEKQIRDYEWENNMVPSKFIFHAPLGRDGKTFSDYFYILFDKPDIIPLISFEPREEPKIEILPAEMADIRKKFHLLGPCIVANTNCFELTVLGRKPYDKFPAILSKLKSICSKLSLRGWKLEAAKGRGLNMMLYMKDEKDATIIYAMSKFFDLGDKTYRLSLYSEEDDETY